MIAMAIAKDVVGYFVWVNNLSGNPTCEKISKEIFEGKLVVRPRAREELEARQIGHKVALTDDEWLLSLDELATKYPCPQTVTNSPID